MGKKVLRSAPLTGHGRVGRVVVLKLTEGRDFRLVWTASIVSQLGDWSARLALALLVLERGGGPTAVGVVGMLLVLPWLGIGQVLTAWASRYGRRVVLIACDSFRGIAFIVIGTWSPSTVPLLAIVFLAALADPVFEATKSAFVSEIVPKDEYAGAIQITHAANQASALIGYAAGGLIVGFFGAEFTLNVNGATFLVSSLLIVAVRQAGVADSTGASKPSLANALGFLRLDRISAICFVATVVANTTAMSVEAQVAAYGQLVAGFGDEAIGLLSATTPAATLIAVALTRAGTDDRTLLRKALVVAAIASAGAAALFFAGVGGVLAFAAFALVGVIFAFSTVTNIVVGRRLPDGNRASIFSILQGGIFLGLSAGAVSGGLLSEATSPEFAAGAALALGTVFLLASATRVGQE